MPKRVLILGAGFTKAFFPKAPTLEDEYDLQRLEKNIAGLEHACRILAIERKRNSGSNRINIERLMTRLENGMPYDRSRKADHELEILNALLKESFIEQIDRAKKGDNHRKQLLALATHCIRTQVDCLTYNYDDLFDETLWSMGGKSGFGIEDKLSGITHFWNPSTGYGFPCESFHTRSMSSIAPSYPSKPLPSSMSLLKLHGSVSWRIRLGVAPPYELRSIVHYSDWEDPFGMVPKDAGQYLEPTPFIVPPVLVKSVLVEQPILRFVWSKAYKILSEAEEVYFVGYSFPLTDIASLHLFSEAISPGARITVINFAERKADEVPILETYSKVFSQLSSACFRFDGALKWAEDFTKAS